MANARRRRSSGRPEQTTADSQGLSEKQRQLLLLVLIVALAAFLRFYQLTSFPPGLTSDEAMNGNDGLEAVETGHFSVFYPQNGGREGLFINIQAAFVQVLGNQAWVLRLPSAIFGILTVWALYFLARKLFSPAVGLLSSFFLATSLWHVIFSRIGLRAISSAFFLVWATYLLLDALDRAREGGAYRGRMAWAGVVYGLGFHTYIAYRVSPALIGLVLAYSFAQARKQDWIGAWRIGVALYAAMAAVVVLPLAVYFAGNSEMLVHRSAEVSVLHTSWPVLEILANIRKTVQMIFTKGDYDWLHNIAFRPVVFWPVAILLALGITLGCIALYRGGRRFAYAVVLLWLALGSVPAVLSIENMPNAIRSILMIPPICMLAAAAAYWIYERLSRKVRPQWLQLAGVLVLLALCYEPYHSYFDVWAPNYNVSQVFNVGGADEAARINALPKTTPKYVVAVMPGRPGMPPATQTVMFLTGSYTKRQQDEQNIHYIAREAGEPTDGVAFCQTMAARLKVGSMFCLQVNWSPPPVF